MSMWIPINVFINLRISLLFHMYEKTENEGYVHLFKTSI